MVLELLSHKLKQGITKVRRIHLGKEVGVSLIGKQTNKHSCRWCLFVYLFVGKVMQKRHYRFNLNFYQFGLSWPNK